MHVCVHVFLSYHLFRGFWGMAPAIRALLVACPFHDVPTFVLAACEQKSHVVVFGIDRICRLAGSETGFEQLCTNTGHEVVSPRDSLRVTARDSVEGESGPARE